MVFMRTLFIDAVHRKIILTSSVRTTVAENMSSPLPKQNPSYAPDLSSFHSHEFREQTLSDYF